MAHYLTAAIAPPHLSGKKLFPHSFVSRGLKKTKTTLGELSLQEYNLGFIRLMNSGEIDPSDRPYMFQHLEHVNEDATVYDFTSVRAWSEEVCGIIAEGELSWDDYYTIDPLRLKLSQNGPKSKDQRTSGRPAAYPNDFSIELSPEVRAARPGPPCRAFNNGVCPSGSHHISNGFRQLHVCSSCVFHKCDLLPHSEKDC